MHKESINLGPLTLVGLATRTNNNNEVNSDTSKIAQLAGSYWQDQVANNFNHRINPGVTYSIYTDYESDETGNYTYFIGELVSSTDDQDLTNFKSLVIPSSSYQKLTTEPGPMPDIIISSWKKVWQMNEQDLGGKRKYIADFEVYDQRASDPRKAVVDLFIGIE